MGAYQFTQIPSVSELIKLGDRLFGWLIVTCPDCIRTRAYWIYAVHGEGGWFSELPEGHYPAFNNIVKILPQIRNSPEEFFINNNVPESSRRPIENLP